MTTENTLEVQGTLRAYPLAELLVEIANSKMSGSLRLSREDRKGVLYLNDGKMVFGVSNAREHRLFNVLMEKHRIAKEAITKYPHFANDLELSASLVSDEVLTSDAAKAATIGQIEGVLVDILSWVDGDWVFSPNARLKAELMFDVPVNNVLISYARCLPLTITAQRFRSVEESFTILEDGIEKENLLPHETAVLSHFSDTPVKIDELRTMTAMPDQGFLQSLYVLWLGGALIRQNWNAAFTPQKVSEILSAKLLLVKKATSLASSPTQKTDDAAEAEAETTDRPAAAEVPIVEMTLDEYLERVENAATHYDLLGISEKAAADEIKNAYFGMAKLFHPDRYHRETGTVLRRIQVAFTSLANAYETLKKKDSRDSYDFKIRKELADRERRRAEGLTDVPDEADVKGESGLQSFEQGLAALSDEEYDAAATLLARAVHYSPENALFHAYYGQALSADGKMRHKAESELQAAVRLDPKNSKIRMMLVDFFLEMGMAKRAEGELRRFLEVVPGDTAAARLLNKIQTQ